MKRNLRFTQVAVAICAVALCACGRQPAQKQEAEYGVLTVKKSHQTVATTYPTAIKGRQDIDIYPQVSGFITRVCIEEGEKVRKGQTLFIIDQVGYKAALQTAKANVQAAAAAVATADLTFRSKEALFAGKVISEFELRTAENAYLSAKAQLALMQAQEVSAANNLSYTEVKSPSDGVAGTLPFRVGALVSPSSPRPLTTISDNSQMYAYFSMNESQLLSLTRIYGSKEEILKSMPEVELRLNDQSVYGSKGKIETISGMIDRNTGSVNIRAAFPNDQELLYSGSSGNIIIPVTRENVLVIPQIATFDIQDKVFVYKVVNGKARSFPVKVTSINGGREYMVLDGLQEGEIIISEGVGLLREGTPVKVKSQKEA